MRVIPLAAGRHSRARFGPFELDLEAGELRKHGIRRRLEQKPLQILRLLLERQGKLVSRTELFAEVWPKGVTVDFEHGLNSAVNRLRQALGDSVRKPRYIETLPKRGYRFVGRVSFVEQPCAAERIMLAVLPFRCRENSEDREYLGDGIAEEVLVRLARIAPQRLGVISRTSVAQYGKVTPGLEQIDQMGRDLGVSHVLEGSLRQSNDRIRIQVQLTAVKDQSLVWAETYDRTVADVFALQKEVALTVARALLRELFAETPPPLPPDAAPPPEAYELFLQGRFHLNRRTPPALAEAADLFRQGIEQAPEFAPLHAALAELHVLSMDYGLATPGEAYPAAENAAEAARRLDPNLPGSVAILAHVLHRYRWEWSGAEKLYRRAVDLDPNNAPSRQYYAEFLSQMGRHDEALAMIEEARRLDPLSLIVRSVHAWLLFHARRYEDACDLSRRTLEMDPSFPVARFILGRSLVQLHRSEEAVEILEEGSPSGRSSFVQSEQVVALARAGRTTEAQKACRELAAGDGGEAVSPWLLAKAALALGEQERAVELVEQAYGERSGWLADLRVDPEMDELRSEPRVTKVYRALNFPA